MPEAEGERRAARWTRYGTGDARFGMSAPARRVWAALGVVYFVWGSTYLGIKVAVETLPPLLAAGTRFLAAGALLSLVLALRGRSLRISARDLLSCAVAGLL